MRYGLERWADRLGWSWQSPPGWSPGCVILLDPSGGELGRVTTDGPPSARPWTWDLKVPRMVGGIVSAEGLATPTDAQTELLATALLERWAHEQRGCRVELVADGEVEVYLDGAPCSNSILKLVLRRISGSPAGGWCVSALNNTTSWEHGSRTDALAQLADGVMGLFDLDGQVPWGVVAMPEPEGAEIDLGQLARTRLALEGFDD